MTLTVATPSVAAPALIDLHYGIASYSSQWPTRPENNYISNVPVLRPFPWSRIKSQHRWTRNTKNSSKRKSSIKFGEKLFWAPYGKFPGGNFSGLPDFKPWENVTEPWPNASVNLARYRGLPLSTPHDDSDLTVCLEDTVKRGVGILAGYAPTPQGKFPPVNRTDNQEWALHRPSPLFGFVSLMLMKEVLFVSMSVGHGLVIGVDFGFVFNLLDFFVLSADQSEAVPSCT